jgi:hypothetical protein
MRVRCLYFLVGLCAAASLALGQTGTKKTYTPPRTADGHPDFSGPWVNNMATPLERPKELADRAFLTDKETEALRKKAREIFNGQGDAAFGDTVFNTALANVSGTKSGFVSTDGETGDYSSVWTVDRTFDNRTSLVTDPPDGRIPAMTPEGQKRSAENAAGMRRIAVGPEDRLLQERCITYGSPSLVAGYQSGYEIAQTPGSVVVVTEMIHDVRVIPTDGRPHLDSNVRNWLGDSRGRWDGDTLVVDTTNYKPRAFRGVSSEQLHVTERFTRTGPEDLKYEITINDPGTWTKPWSLMINLKRSSGALYEYACHEGNVGMVGILAGARVEEQSAGSK